MFGIGGSGADGGYSVPEPSAQATDLDAPKVNIGGSVASGAMAGTAIMPGWGTLIGAGVGLLGGILGNKSSAKQASSQMAFQERMSSTAHQREVRDLELAGLNPVLSANGGSGASSPSGAAAPVANVGESMVSGAKAGWEADVQRKVVGQQIANLYLESGEKAQNIENTRQDTSLKYSQNKEVMARVLNTQQDTAYKAQMTSLGAIQVLTEKERRGLISKQALNEGIQSILLRQEVDMNRDRAYLLGTDAKSSAIDRQVMDSSMTVGGVKLGEKERRVGELWGSTAGEWASAIPGVGKILDILKPSRGPGPPPKYQSPPPPPPSAKEAIPNTGNRGYTPNWRKRQLSTTPVYQTELRSGRPGPPQLKELQMDKSHDEARAIQRVRIVNPYSLNFYSTYNRGPRVTFSAFGEDRAMQNFIAECDINTILARYKATGILPEVRQAAPQFLDATSYDYQQAMDIVAEAQSVFYNMPSAIRARFDNDPAQLLEFVHNPANLEESVAMGFIDPSRLPTPKEAPATPPAASQPVSQQPTKAA